MRLGTAALIFSLATGAHAMEVELKITAGQTTLYIRQKPDGWYSDVHILEGSVRKAGPFKDKDDAITDFQRWVGMSPPPAQRR